MCTQSVEARLARLESERRTSRLLLCVIMAVLGAGVMAAAGLQATDKEFRTRSIVLEDDAGKIRAVLMTNKDGAVMLGLMNAASVPQIVLSVDKDGAVVEMADMSGKTRSSLSVNNKLSTTSLAFFDSAQKTRTTLGVTSEGSGALGFMDAAGKPRAAMASNQAGASIEMSDDQGKSLVVLTADEKGPSLVFRDAEGKIRTCLEVTKDGTHLTLMDRLTKSVAWLTTKGEPKLVIRDSAGNVKWSSP